MPAPLPEALRRRIVAAVVDEKLTIPEAASRFMAGEATVKRLLWRFRATGNVEPSPMGGDRVSRIPRSDAEKLVTLVEEMPDGTIAELVAAYETRYGVSLSPAAMSRTLAREALTRKKKPSCPRSATRRASPTPATDSGSSRR